LPAPDGEDVASEGGAQNAGLTERPRLSEEDRLLEIERYDINSRVTRLFEALANDDTELALEYLSPADKEAYYRAKETSGSDSYSVDDFLNGFFDGVDEIGGALPGVGGIVKGAGEVIESLIKGGRSLYNNIFNNKAEENLEIIQRLGALEIVLIGEKYAEASGEVLLSGAGMEAILKNMEDFFANKNNLSTTEWSNSLTELANELGFSAEEIAEGITYEKVARKLTVKHWIFYLEKIDGTWYTYKTEVE
jgi:hypothetical protein